MNTMHRSIQPTRNGISINITDGVKITELEVLLKLTDSLLADRQDEEVEANLLSARIHIVRAIKEAAACTKTTN